MESIWSKTVRLPQGQELAGDLYVKNVVIGAGMAGILTAYLLKKNGEDVIVIEADDIAGGQTKNTTAKITSQHDLRYQDMIKKAGFHRAQGYAMANELAIRSYEKIVRTEGISCDFQRLPSFLYSTVEADRDLLQQEAKAAKTLGIDAYYVEGNHIQELPFSVAGAVCFENQAQFHPLAFIKALSEQLRIYEKTRVLSVHEHVITTDKGTVTAEHIIFATHYPFSNVPGFYFIRQHQERSYVLSLAGEDVPRELSGMYYGIDQAGLSFRCAEGRLLLGGGAHRTGKKAEKCEVAGYRYLRKQAKQFYPNATEDGFWAAEDCMPHDRIPFIGKYSIFRPYWYVATGFQKWGMTSSMIAATIISDQICGRVNPYENIFSPQRLMISMGIKNLGIDLCESVAGLTKGFLGSRSERCSHMGCHLEWNEEERTWDCPCHGSRFHDKGDVIDNPAKRPISRR